MPDTIEDRFGALATIVALIVVRLEQGGAAGDAASVALTERFIESMDAEIRQMGISDPKLGRQVRSLVASLAGRVERWRHVRDSSQDWETATLSSLYRDTAPEAAALAHSAEALREFDKQLQALSVEDIAQGRLG